MKQFQLSVIICATDIMQAYSVCKNIEQTSGCYCQFLIHDNSKCKLPIANVYNQYMRIAKANNLLFVHQDVKFFGQDWCVQILKKLQEQTCGAIGYAGSVYRPKDFYAGWPVNMNLSRCNYMQKITDVKIQMNRNQIFDEVCVLDGLALFARKDIAMKHPFDKKILTGFHCYDIDFTLSLFVDKFKNYVYVDKRFPIFHQSCGKYTDKWALMTLKMTQQKWNNVLPVKVEGIQLVEDDLKAIEYENQKFINILQKYCTFDEAFDAISKLPYKQKQLKPTGLYNNGYRSWN